MGGIKSLAAILLISLLIFGCFGAPQTPATGTGGTTPSGGGSTGGTGGTGGQTGGGATDGGSTGDSTGGIVEDLTGKSYEELMGLGIPMQCDMTMTYEGTTTTVKHYILDSEHFRSEMTSTQESACPGKMIFIVKGDDMYMGCEGQKYPTGTTCDWMKITSEPSETGSGGTGSAQAPDYTNVPSTQISCTPWIPDQSKLNTPGKACTLEDMMNEISGGSYPN